MGRVGLDPDGDPEIGRLRPTGVVGDGVEEVVGRLESEVERGDMPVYEEGREMVVAWLLVGTGGGVSGLCARREVLGRRLICCAGGL